jgi:hypothetical protein
MVHDPDSQLEALSSRLHDIEVVGPAGQTVILCVPVCLTQEAVALS